MGKTITKQKFKFAKVIISKQLGFLPITKGNKFTIARIDNKHGGTSVSFKVVDDNVLQPLLNGETEFVLTNGAIELREVNGRYDINIFYTDYKDVDTKYDILILIEKGITQIKRPLLSIDLKKTIEIFDNGNIRLTLINLGKANKQIRQDINNYFKSLKEDNNV